MDNIKIIGKRKRSSGGLVNTNNLLKLVIELRGNKPFYPKGLYRVSTQYSMAIRLSCK